MEHLDRNQKATRILENGGVHPVHPETGIWSVDSESSTDQAYRVDLAAGTCTCPDSIRHTCKHSLAAGRAASILFRPATRQAAPRTIDSFIAFATSPQHTLDSNRQQPLVKVFDPEKELCQDDADWLAGIGVYSTTPSEQEMNAEFEAFVGGSR